MPLDLCDCYRRISDFYVNCLWVDFVVRKMDSFGLQFQNGLLLVFDILTTKLASMCEYIYVLWNVFDNSGMNMILLVFTNLTIWLGLSFSLILKRHHVISGTM